MKKLSFPLIVSVKTGYITPGSSESSLYSHRLAFLMVMLYKAEISADEKEYKTLEGMKTRWSAKQGVVQSY